MSFPIFDMPWMGNALLMALDAVVHVFISHGIAIGAVVFIVISEYIGLRYAAPEWEDFARRLSKPTVIVVAAIGAPTGAGIWLIASVIAPRAIASMLRLFFWPWFIEWMVFVTEVSLLLVYYFTWDRWTGPLKRRHVWLGSAYVAASAMTAVLISGILGFMLTSDGWPWQRRFVQAYFNPTFLPQVVLRFAESLLLGSLYASCFLLLTKQDTAFRRRALRIFSWVGAGSTVVAALAAVWYFKASPAAFTVFLTSTWGFPWLAQNPAWLWRLNVVAVGALVAFLLIAVSGRWRAARAGVVVAVVFALALVAEFEFIRESIRKPYIMPGYMYSNQMLLSEQQYFRQSGLLANSYWYNIATDKPSLQQQGAYLFLQNCSRCHTIGGFNDIRQRLQGRSPDGIRVILEHTDKMVPFMPPFSGNDDERTILAEYLYTITNPPRSPTTGRSGGAQ
ncbi:MAG TPA: c-type cytochrome [Terracidiphilus sp.]|nr:c-type cytochrome [Terracidiphilus sp.]